jgi:hypothetical protein
VCQPLIQPALKETGDQSLLQGAYILFGGGKQSLEADGGTCAGESRAGQERKLQGCELHAKLCAHRGLPEETGC